MPTLLRWKGFRFYFFSNEGHEPPHLHVDKEDKSAKIWLKPVVLAANYGFGDHEIRVILAKIADEQAVFLERWDEYFKD